jgi:SAM-dependent methyltransferase
MTSYALLLLPSANRVYTGAAVELSLAELEVFNRAVLDGRLTDLATTMIGGVGYVTFGADRLSERDVAYLSNVSTAYALFERDSVGDADLLRPVPLKPLDHFDDDLITIPKYAGKTNEQFTKLLLNVTLLSSAAGPEMLDRKLHVLDPLCGRGTTLNQVLMYGYDAAGVDLDGKDFEAYAGFLRTYLTRKRIKHRLTEVPVRRERRLVARRLTGRIGPERSAEALNLDVVNADTVTAGDFFKPGTFDALVADAPYGVQHGSRTVEKGLRRGPLDLLQAAAPGWSRLLRPGGALGLSWNTTVARREDAAAALEEAGLRVRGDGPYGQFRHRVDQAITRDILIAVRPRQDPLDHDVRDTKRR